jgi:phosphotransferase system enzyme I (PtsI)
MRVISGVGVGRSAVLGPVARARPVPAVAADAPHRGTRPLPLRS